MIDARRASPDKRGYDSAWKRLREQFLRMNPLCQCDECIAQQRVLPADVVDHIVPISERPELRLAWSNLRSMTKRCHDARTARDQLGAGGAIARAREASSACAQSEFIGNFCASVGRAG